MLNVDINFYARYNGWDRLMCEKVKFEYERFMELRATNSNLSPPDQIDKFWHTHILDTNSYLSYCLTQWNRIIHHNPAEAQDQLARAIRLSNTLTVYKETYGNFTHPEVWAQEKPLAPVPTTVYKSIPVPVSGAATLSKMSKVEPAKATHPSAFATKSIGPESITNERDPWKNFIKTLPRGSDNSRSSSPDTNRGYLVDQSGRKIYKDIRQQIKSDEKNLPIYTEWVKSNPTGPLELGFYIRYELAPDNLRTRQIASTPFAGQIIKVKIGEKTTWEDVEAYVANKLGFKKFAGFDIKIMPHPDYVEKPKPKPLQAQPTFQPESFGSYFEYPLDKEKPNQIVKSNTADCKLYVVRVIEMTPMGYC